MTSDLPSSDLPSSHGRTRAARGLLRLVRRRGAAQTFSAAEIQPAQSRVVPPGFAPVLRALLCADERLAAERVLSLARDRAGAGVSWARFRGDVDRTWLALGKEPSVMLLELAAAAWPSEPKPGPEHAA